MTDIARDLAPPHVARHLARPGRGFLAPGSTFASIEGEVTGVAFDHPGWKLWWLAFVGAMGLLGVLILCLGFLFWDGVGIWGNNIPVTWALDIVGYDWWMGVACGALLTSAMLLLLGSEWRGALNRVTETVALLGACSAGVYPIIHLGRPWFFYWNLPYPNTLALWPQFRSPLYWDAVDIISFLGIALSFWYIGMLPDLASLRDRAFERALAAGGGFWPMLRAQTYGVLALGWRGSASHWQRWSHSYRTIALLGVLVVIALQSGAAVMFAGTVLPGWHDTLEPVSFLAGALLAGVAVVAVLAVLMRWVFALQPLITPRHLDVLGRLLLGLTWLNIYCYAWDFFMTGLTGDAFQVAAMGRRVGSGSHAWAWWAIVGCALLPAQLFFVPPLRRSPVILAGLGALIAFAMWADHFMVIVDALQQDFLPSSFHLYTIDAWGVATYAGSVGLFLVLLLLFLRYMPVVSIVETRRLARLAEPVPVAGRTMALRRG